MLSLLAGLNQTNTKSALGLRAALPSNRQSVSELLRTNMIHQHYRSQGGRNGRFGYPVDQVRFEGVTATRSYRGGQIQVLADKLQPELPTLEASITFLGANCTAQSHDGLTAHDEPYFIISVDQGDGAPKTDKFGPFEKVDAGTVIGVGAFLKDKLVPNPTTIRVVAYENDEGDPDETAKKIQDEIVKLSQQAQSLASSGADAAAADAADGPGIGVGAAAGTIGAIAAGPLGALVASAIVSVFGLGDDFVGQNAAQLFMSPDNVGTPPTLGQFQGTDFHSKITVGGNDEGAYDLFFNVLVKKVEVAKV